LVQEFSRIRVYAALALPIILYGSEFWTFIENDKKKMGINRDAILQKNSWVHHF
jgi:hypothetical protein